MLGRYIEAVGLVRVAAIRPYEVKERTVMTVMCVAAPYSSLVQTGFVSRPCVANSPAPSNTPKVAEAARLAKMPLLLAFINWMC